VSLFIMETLMNPFAQSARRSNVARRVAASLGAATCLSSFTAALCSTAAVAQEPPAHAFEQITVTADRITPTAPGEEAARAEASRVPGGAGVVSAEEYADGRASTFADVFAFSPGVFAQPRFGAEEARLSIRGSGLQRTFHMRGIYLLQDGVPITLADGGGDFQAVEPLALAYTEVRRGANALEYGGTTLGGSINFVSPSGHDHEGFRARIEGGSFGYRRALVSAGDVLGNSDYFASASAYEQDGYRNWSRQQNGRFFGNAGFRLGGAAETRFFVSAVHTDSQLPGSLTQAQLNADREQANPSNVAGRQKRDFDLYRLANRTVIELDGDFLELTAGYSYKDLFHPIFQVVQQRSNDYNAGLRYVNEHRLAGRANRLVVGASPSWNRVNDDRFVNVAGRRGAPTAASDQRSSNLTAFAQSELEATPRWTLVAGLQWTDASRRYEDLFLSNGDQSLDVSYSRVSPKLGFLWRAVRGWTVYGNLSDSFEPPSFGELSGGVGVDLLDAQRPRTVEIGTRGETARVRWDISAYSARVRDEMLGLNAPGGQPLGTVNAPRTLHQGLELGAQLAITPTLSWNSAYLWSRFRFDDNASYGDNALPGIPEHFYRGELTWSPHAGYFIGLNTEWSPRRYAVDMAHTLFADSYALVGVKAGFNASRGISWFIEGRNLADRTYAATTGVIADARGLDAAQFLPGDGRAVYAGISWRPR
jgi:iron complex outermembrane receptor protein